MRIGLLGVALALIGGNAAADPACPGRPDALGVSREIVVRHADYARLGRMQYRQTLPLNDREVVLTFDDGPLPPYSDRVLEILAQECVKATFFLVGRMARANPAAVRRIYNAGHTVGTHSQNHPIRFDLISSGRAEHEIDDGIASVVAALGDAKALAPYFRIPGLGRTAAVEAHLQSRALVVWSSDTLADDWRRISANEVLRLAVSRLERKGKGVLLLHDIQPRMVMILPRLLAELKQRGFKIVHVVPEGERPILPEPQLVASASKQAWPRVLLSPPLPPLPPQRATTGSSGDTAPAAATPDAEPIPPGEVVLAEDVPLPLPRPVRHAGRPAKPQIVAAIRDLHGAQ
jgi:peptidoglycan/xylan/chitin deacetylase (PgdA/CDA1 family)